MIKYYADSEEKYLKSVIAYEVLADGASPFLAWDQEGTQPVYADEVLPLFRKGLLLIHMGDAVSFAECLPVLLETSPNGVTISTNGDSFYQVPFSSNGNVDSGQAPVTPGDLINPSNGS